MKILNLYCGIGGNRKLWGEEHQVTAVELDPKIAAVYKELFPNDTVIIGDAHKYLQQHFNEFDFIWASPPCQTHSSFRQNIGVRFSLFIQI
jgi:DNA (cytosine-5)-methyltransferase 1